MSDTKEECEENMNHQKEKADFGKILRDFLKDILLTFPELESTLDDNLRAILDDSEDINERMLFVQKQLEEVYPERFFDILYQNDSMFEQESKLELLPGIDFRSLWKENISKTTRETIWKYLQLILFTIVSDLSDSTSFGNTANLFEAIDKDEFREKIEKTISQMQSCFEENQDETTSGNSEGINIDDLPDPSSIHEHVSGMMEGKLGNLAREIAEETAQDMNIEMEDESTVGDVFQKLLKDPTKLMGLVEKVGGKLDEKIKTGELKESELLEEAGNIMQKMKDMPGMSNIQNMFGGMAGMGGNAHGKKMNMGAMQAHLERNTRIAKQRERMKQKNENKKKNDDETENMNKNMNMNMNMEEALKSTNIAIADLLRSEGVSEEGIEQMIFSTGETYSKSKRSDAPTQSDNRSKNGKKKKKKKNKGKY